MTFPKILSGKEKMKKVEKYLFTQCIVRLYSSLSQDTADTVSVYGFQTNYTGWIWTKIRKKPSRTKIQRHHQFVVTGSEQGFEPWLFMDGYHLSLILEGKKGWSFSTCDFRKLTVALEFLFAFFFDLQQELWSTIFTFWCHWCKEKKKGKIFNMYKWAYPLKGVIDWFVQLRI